MTVRRLLLVVTTIAWSTSVMLALARNEPPARAVEWQQGRGPTGPLFSSSDECLACHNNLTTTSGEDVSIGASWRGSMMANAARDPYFLASLRRETIDHASHAGEIQEECARCHVAAAQRTTSAAGRKVDVFAHAEAWQAGRLDAVDTLAADGVTCTVCHQIDRERLGTPESYNGNFVLAPPLPSGNRRANGPHPPDAGRLRIMHSVTGVEQAEAPHIRQSELCASCHTLITNALGPKGEVIGSLPEQMTYPEWRHSAQRQSCQACHMPAVRGPVRISSVLGQDRDTLARHTFLGGNAFMLRLLNRFRVQLGVQATPAELEASARATTRLLETETATVAIDRAERTGGTLMIDVAITNLTGHKFPTGYPSRRAWLHVMVRDAADTVVFESGRVAATGRIEGNDGDASAGAFEPHYAEMTRSDQVQVYESVMGNRGGTATTGLLDATQYLKDNRLLPAGFDQTTASADIRSVGEAARDPDFSGGSDRVRYRVPVPGGGSLTVTVELLFQPIGYRWARNLATYKAPEPQAFVGYFDSMASTSSTIVARAARVLDR